MCVARVTGGERKGNKRDGFGLGKMRVGKRAIEKKTLLVL